MEECPWRDDPDALKGLQALEVSLVARHQEVGVGRERALQNPVVRLVGGDALERACGPPGRGEGGDLGEGLRDAACGHPNVPPSTWRSSLRMCGETYRSTRPARARTSTSSHVPPKTM